MRTGVLLATIALAAGSAQQAQPPQPPTFTAGVQVVEVDVRVFDKDGRFIADLTRGDFELIEEGAPQKIAAMYLVGAGQPAALAAPGTPSVPPNAPAGSFSARQTWIFVFDLNHLTPGGGFDRARKAVGDFIGQRFRDGDLAGIVAGENMVNNRLTSVRQELLDAVKQVKPRNDSRSRSIELTRDWPRFLTEDEVIRVSRNMDPEVLRRVVARACSDDPGACERENQVDLMVLEKARRVQQDIHRATLQTLSAANGLASGLARIPGPKTVVFLSDGFVVQDIETTLRSVVGQAARAGARVYAIDARGLNRAGNSGIIDQAQAEDPAGPATKFDAVEDGPNSLAVDTGGLMIRNENNIGRALDRIADDAGRYYVLAYQPSNPTFDGKYRPIQVRVKRDGVRVRARRGYLALPPARLLLPQPTKAPPPVEPAPTEGKSAAPVPNEPPVEPPAGAVAAPVTGTVAPSADVHPGALRLRPDSESRVKALSALDTTPTDALVNEGWDAYQRGDVETAEIAFSKAAARSGARPWVIYALGMSHAALGHAPEAIASWEQVRQAAPDFEPVYMDLADTYAQVSDLTRALAVLRDAEKRWPGDQAVQSGIGVIHVRRGALDEGIAALIKATELAPDDPLTHLNLGRAYQLRFARGRRYVTSQRRWVVPEEDRRKAAEAFQRCIALGGPYARQASEALGLLNWSKQE